MLASLAIASEDPNLNQILQKHLDAMGGLRNWSQIESIRLTGTVERDSQTVDIVIIKKRPDQIRATITIPHPSKPDESLQIIRAHDGKHAWTATRRAGDPNMIKQLITGPAADDLLADAGVLPHLIKLWRAGEKFKLVGMDQVENQQVYVIDLKPTTGSKKQRFYLSTASYLTVAYETHTPSDNTRTTLTNYQEARGVLLPTLSKVTADSTGDSKIQTNSIQIGVGIYEEYFEPEAQRQTADL